METLYNISERYLSVLGMLETVPEENTDDYWQAVTDTLDGIEAEFDVKAENIGAYIKNLKYEAEALKTEEKALAERRKAKENAAERLKTYLLDNMQAIGVRKIDRPKACVSVRKNAESVRFDDETAFVGWAEKNNEDFLRYKQPDINRTAVKKFLQSGGEIEGVSLERSETLTIK